MPPAAASAVSGLPSARSNCSSSLAAGGGGEGGVEGGPGHAGGERADARAEEVEGTHGYAETPVGDAEDVVGGDGDGVEVEGAEGMRGERVEEALLRHPDVLEAAVVGRSDEGRGQVVVAYAVLRAGAARTGRRRGGI